MIEDSEEFTFRIQCLRRDAHAVYDPLHDQAINIAESVHKSMLAAAEHLPVEHTRSERRLAIATRIDRSVRAQLGLNFIESHLVPLLTRELGFLIDPTLPLYLDVSAEGQYHGYCDQLVLLVRFKLHDRRVMEAMDKLQRAPEGSERDHTLQSLMELHNRLFHHQTQTRNSAKHTLSELHKSLYDARNLASQDEHAREPYGKPLPAALKKQLDAVQEPAWMLLREIA
jgi:hypothetical protein